MKLQSAAAAFAITLLSCGGAAGHDVWLTLDGAPDQRRVVINYGHPDDRPPALADKAVNLVAIGANGEIDLRADLSVAVRDGAVVAITRPFADDVSRLFAARYDNGFWVKTADGYRNATRRSAPDALEAVWSGKFAKAIDGARAPWQRALGHDLEIVPLADPAALRVGETISVRVLFHGRPLPDVQVERGDGKSHVREADIPRFRTGADGVAAVPIVSDGPQLLVVDHRIAPSTSPDQADADLFNATLWFLVGAK